MVRPIPESALEAFGQKFVKQDWSILDSYSEPNGMSLHFENIMKKYTDTYFPQKQVFVSNWDKPFFTEELRLLRRRRQRYYQKYGKNDTYVQLSADFQSKLLSKRINTERKF